MAEQEKISKTDTASSNDEKLNIQHIESGQLDADAQRLADLGYKQEFKREVSLFVQTGFSFSTMAVLPSWMSGFGGVLMAGGPSSLFWGWVVVSPFATCIALSMAEIISAYPLAGGVYSWSLYLSDAKWGPLMSWLSGYIYLAGLITASMTLAYASCTFIYGTANTLGISQIDNEGAYVGLYFGLIIAGTIYNMLGMKFSAYLNKFMVVWVIIGGFIMIIAVPAMAPTHPTAEWVFTAFTNNTGYSNNGLAFFIGMLNAGWSLVGYECGAQIVEGTKNAAVTAPRGIIICIASAIIQGFALVLSTLFSIQDIDELVESSFPMGVFYLRATNRGFTAFFMVVLLLSQLTSMCNSLVAAAQLMWSMARDGCLPYSKFLYKLEGEERIPMRCMLVQMVICIVVILPIFGSAVYWTAIMSTAVICINISYGLPLLCRLIWVRNNMPKGPFSLGKFGIPLNIIGIAWVIFFSVILCIPSVAPVTPATMNWASLMLGSVTIFSLIFWYMSGRHHYKGVREGPDHHTDM